MEFLDVIRVPQTGLSNRSLAGLQAQPVRRGRINAQSLEIAEHGNDIEFQIRTVAIPTGFVRNVDPDKGHLPDVGPHFRYQRCLGHADGTAAIAPSRGA